MVQARFLNDTTKIEVHGESTETSVSVRSESQPTTVKVKGIIDHNELFNRDLSNQHPISAITDLEDTINEISDKIEDNSTNINNLISRVTTNEENIVTLDEKKAERSELQAEITNRENADNDLSEKIDTIEDDLTEDIDSLSTIVDNNYSTLDTRITNVADELGQSIEENVVALQQEDSALQNQINAQAQSISGYDARITNNANAITQEITNRQNADNELQDQIDNLSSRGRFLSLWDATTGLAESTPQISPYTYKTGDYFIVDKVGDVNYRPSGTEYVVGQASTVIETEELATDDAYFFDGATWHLQINHGKSVSFSNLAGEPSDNTALKNALDSKQDTISDIDEIRSGAKLGSTALQSFTETDPTVPSYVKSITQQNITNWNNKSDFSGNYDDLTNKPTKLSDFDNDSGFITQDYHDNTKQNTLVSGENIKTLNNESLLGEGNIDITSAQWGNITGDITDQTDLKSSLDSKQNKLTAGTNIEIDPNTNTISATTGYAEIIFRKWSDD